MVARDTAAKGERRAGVFSGGTSPAASLAITGAAARNHQTVMRIDRHAGTAKHARTHHSRAVGRRGELMTRNAVSASDAARTVPLSEPREGGNHSSIPRATPTADSLPAYR